MAPPTCSPTDRAMGRAVKAIGPHASFIPNMGGASLMDFDLSVIDEALPFPGRRPSGPHAAWRLGWSAGRDGKRMRAAFPTVRSC